MSLYINWFGRKCFHGINKCYFLLVLYISCPSYGANFDCAGKGLWPNERGITFFKKGSVESTVLGSSLKLAKIAQNEILVPKESLPVQTVPKDVKETRISLFLYPLGIMSLLVGGLITRNATHSGLSSFHIRSTLHI